ncbi:hypothetical protein KR215_011037, partial [Drosophila sulfurigaster]
SNSNSNSNQSNKSAIATEQPLASISYKDEQKTSEVDAPAPAPAPAPTSAPAAVTSQPPRTHFTSSHHHYHLPHQFQHPHHQNHHTHHSVRVATPTVPSSYAPPPAGQDIEGTGRSPVYAHRAIAPVLSSSAMLGATPTEAVAHVSPGRLSARSGSQHHVTIDESSLPHKSSLESAGPSGLIVGGGDGDANDDIGQATTGGGGGGGSGGGGDSSEPPSSPGSSSQRQLSQSADGERQAGQLALMYHSHQLTNYPVMPAIKRTHRPSFVYPPMPRVKA